MPLDRTSISFILLGATVAIGARTLVPSESLQGAVPRTPPAGQPAAVPDPSATPAAKAAPRFRTAVANPKALSERVHNGLAWLVGHQQSCGGWGQGDEASSMRQAAPELASQRAETANVGDTCAALLAILRCGASFGDDRCGSSLSRGFAWLCERVEASDESSMTLDSPQGTRLQSKLGPHIDVFLASLALSEARGRLGDVAAEGRVDAALRKVLRKIELNQRQDGSWGGGGWAPVLAESMAAKGLNRAAQSAVAVDAAVLDRLNAQARREVATSAGFGGEGNAGVALYAGASNLGKLQDASVTLADRRTELDAIVAASPAAPAREQAQQELKSIADVTRSCDEMRSSLIARLDDPAFVAGFGSNGGEEFLSYLNIGESLVIAGGDAWARWDASMTANLDRIQNEDGSWTGHHCITGRTFCTATALMVLAADRTPVPE